MKSSLLLATLLALGLSACGEQQKPAPKPAPAAPVKAPEAATPTPPAAPAAEAPKADAAAPAAAPAAEMKTDEMKKDEKK